MGLNLPLRAVILVRKGLQEPSKGRDNSMKADISPGMIVLHQYRSGWMRRMDRGNRLVLQRAMTKLRGGGKAGEAKKKL